MFKIPIQYLDSNTLDWSESNYDSKNSYVFDSAKSTSDVINNRVGEIILIHISDSNEGISLEEIQKKVISGGGTESDAKNLWKWFSNSRLVSKNIFMDMKKSYESWRAVDSDTSSNFVTIKSLDDLTDSTDYNKMSIVEQLTFILK
jgi:hypothetical protein